MIPFPTLTIASTFSFTIPSHLLEHLLSGATNPIQTPGRIDMSVIDHKKSVLDGLLKRVSNARPNGHPSNPAQIWGGYGAHGPVRHVGPEIPNPPQIAPNQPPRSIASICSILSFFSSAADVLQIRRHPCSATVPSLSTTSPGTTVLSPILAIGDVFAGSDATAVPPVYGPTKLDQIIHDEFFESSNLGEEVDMSMQEEMDRRWSISPT